MNFDNENIIAMLLLYSLYSKEVLNIVSRYSIYDITSNL